MHTLILTSDIKMLGSCYEIYRKLSENVLPPASAPIWHGLIGTDNLMNNAAQVLTVEDFFRKQNQYIIKNNSKIQNIININQTKKK